MTTLAPAAEAPPYAHPTSWDLSELVADPSETGLGARLRDLDEASRGFEAARHQLTPDMAPEDFLEILGRYQAILEQMTVLESYASLWFASNTQSQAALTFQNRVSQASAATTNRILFFELWWKSLNDAEAEALLPRGTEHADERHYLSEVRRFRPHTLPESSEKVITLKDSDGIGGLLTLYSVLTNRLEFEIESDGETRTLTRDQLMGYVHSPRPELREAAYKELYRVYGGEVTPLAQIYANRVRDWHNEQVELRGFSSPIAVRNLSNDVPDEAVETLLSVIREHVDLFQRYFRLKAELLGVERLRRYDIYAPIADSDRNVEYSAAVDQVLSTFAGFHPRFAAEASRVFDQRHMDSEARKGKRGGAFCATVLPRQTPWVLVNYTGRLRDVLTVAHELGHAVHSMLAEDHSLLTQRSSLPLAETASVFAEMLMTDRLLAEEKNPEARRELLINTMDNIYATVLRQAYFVLFEIAAHDAILAGSSPEELNALYMQHLAEQFGDSVEVSPEFQYEWLSIPHIYNTPFYCYAYCFGQLLVLALYRRYQQEGEAFKPGYLKMLSYGGSARPQEILAEVGVDMTDPAFWRGGFVVLSDLLEELSALCPGSEGEPAPAAD